MLVSAPKMGSLMNLVVVDGVATMPPLVLSNSKGVAKKPTIDRLAKKLNYLGPLPTNRPELGSCWLWLEGNINRYVSLWDNDPGHNRTRGAHRISYELYHGAVPNYLHIDHLCRNPSCCNPHHLEPVTPRENVFRGASLQIKAHLTGVCNRGHRIQPYKECDKCARLRKSEAYRLKKARMKESRNRLVLSRGVGVALIAEIQKRASIRKESRKRRMAK